MAIPQPRPEGEDPALRGGDKLIPAPKSVHDIDLPLEKGEVEPQPEIVPEPEATATETPREAKPSHLPQPRPAGTFANQDTAIIGRRIPSDTDPEASKVVEEGTYPTRNHETPEVTALFDDESPINQPDFDPEEVASPIASHQPIPQLGDDDAPPFESLRDAVTDPLASDRAPEGEPELQETQTATNDNSPALPFAPYAEKSPFTAVDGTRQEGDLEASFALNVDTATPVEITYQLQPVDPFGEKPEAKTLADQPLPESYPFNEDGTPKAETLAGNIEPKEDDSQEKTPAVFHNETQTGSYRGSVNFIGTIESVKALLDENNINTGAFNYEERKNSEGIVVISVRVKNPNSIDPLKTSDHQDLLTFVRTEKTTDIQNPEEKKTEVESVKFATLDISVSQSGQVYLNFTGTRDELKNYINENNFNDTDYRYKDRIVNRVIDGKEEAIHVVTASPLLPETSHEDVLNRYRAFIKFVSDQLPAEKILQSIPVKYLTARSTEEEKTQAPAQEEKKEKTESLPLLTRFQNWRKERALTPAAIAKKERAQERWEDRRYHSPILTPMYDLRDVIIEKIRGKVDSLSDTAQADAGKTPIPLVKSLAIAGALVAVAIPTLRFAGEKAFPKDGKTAAPTTEVQTTDLRPDHLILQNLGTPQAGQIELERSAGATIVDGLRDTKYAINDGNISKFTTEGKETITIDEYLSDIKIATTVDKEIAKQMLDRSTSEITPAQAIKLADWLEKNINQFDKAAEQSQQR